MTSDKSFFFAGGGTGGHIYPAIAVAQQIKKIKPNEKLHFFCSTRDIDKRILTKTDFEYTRLPAVGFSARPAKIIPFCSAFLESHRIARPILARAEKPVVIGLGGFVAAPVCWTAHRLRIPINLINIDIVPGRANKLLARFSKRLFLQFKDTERFFAKTRAKINVVGCPLREAFTNANRDRAIEQLTLDKQKNILLVTGASSGSQHINDTVCSLLEKLDAFAPDWQIVHLTGTNDFQNVTAAYANVKISHKILDYYDDMPGLLAAADLLIGRSGAVSTAEYVAALLPSICIPYPYHKDKHQYLHAAKLVEAAAAIIVDDLPDPKDRAEWLAEELLPLLRDENQRLQMAKGCRILANTNAAGKIAEELLKTDS
jgi:UDP-N-acetylglucosamine--N-acetylmuramyl-(pentapeptide) pyrophosphoryl-undecaprenol N-acetylglucosamine transferase